MKILITLVVGLLLGTVRGVAQNGTGDSPEDVLRKGEIVASNIQKAIMEHIAIDPSFKQTPQSPDERRGLPPMLGYKNGSIEFDWTSGQEARYLMEDIRQGLHQLQAAVKPTGFDAIAFAGGREYWPKLRDISCQEKPGLKYYDLDGFEQYCPTK